MPVTSQSAELHRDALAHRVASGVRLPEAPTSPVLETFDPRALAVLLDMAVHHGRGRGQEKVRVDMTNEDAAKLAQFLRRAALAGVGV